MRWENHGRFGSVRTSLRMKVTLGVVGSLSLIFSGIIFIQVARHETAAISWANLLSMGVVVIATVLAVNLVLSWFVLKRLNALTTVVISFGGGRRHLHFPDNGVDEIGRLTEAFNDMGRHIEAKEAENRVLSDDLSQQSIVRGQLLERLITTQEDERKRLAREIHDDLGQAMGALALQAEVLQKLLPPDANQARAQLSEIKALIMTTTDSMYDMILALRPSALDDLGLVAALRVDADRMLANSGIRFEMDADAFHDHLPPAMEIAVYRMFQEALTNAVRHASARNIRFRLSRRQGLFIGQIEDDGRGFNPNDLLQSGTNPHGLGLLGMKERVTQFDGELEIQSQYGNGTCINIQIPLLKGN